MGKIKLVTDSASDISFENEKRYGIRIIPFKLSVGGKSYTSRVDFDTEGFYRLLEASEEIPVTSQATPFEFTEIYEEYYAAGYTDLIYTAINSKGSSTYSNALIATEDFYAEHPEAQGKFNIYNIDSGVYTGCYGYAVVEAAKMAEKGVDAPEIAAYLRDWCANAAACVAAYELKYMAKSGRVPTITAHMGRLLDIKPIIRLYDHEVATVKKVRTEAKTIPAITEFVLGELEPHTPYCIVYGNDAQLRERMASAMAEATGYPPADYYQMGEAVASNAGPRLVGVLYRKKTG